ncbi:DUF2695 domain-containing protein [Streptomyces sp. NPDC051569]|uniref:DUF2695 domain-containing protein n=1 Tax=Streptomyces sp. NPDC051569 TaxID=3365661 RepID=UPI00379105C5
MDLLLDHLDEELSTQACDHSLRFTERWAAASDVPWPHLQKGLADQGGHCDCEVLANVDPDETL